ncbi:MAG: DUF401 family protein [Nitrospirae bacterium]|nr:DUF401 family protein [Nitrospirota bacterium]
MMVFLLRRKLNVGYVLMAASALIFVLYLMPLRSIAKTLYHTVVSPVSIELAAALILIRILEMILRENNVIRDMMDSIRGVLRNKRAVLISMPLVIGMLPSVGGAHFSCPMVEESAQGLNLSQEDKAFTNYWYRHPWELVLPLYPGVVLATIITNIGIGNLVLLNLSYAVTMLITGFMFCMKDVAGSFERGLPVGRKNFWSFAPITFLVVLVMVFHVRLSIGIAILVVGLIVYFRYGPNKVLSTLKYGMSIEIIVLIAGVMLFKESLDSSGAMSNVSRYFVHESIPLLPLLIVLPFISGLLTGFTLAFVGSAFPLLLSFPGITAHAFSFAFAAGFAGVLLSPVHVCLVLTRDYFQADTWGIYKKIIPAVGIMFFIAIAEYLLFT